MKRLILICLFASLVSCIDDDKRLGNHGESDNIPGSKSHNLFIAIYIPDHFNCHLLDSSSVLLDTAWAETSWIYGKKGKPIPQDTTGYNLFVPIIKQPNKFIFSFSLADLSNQYSTNGMELTRCILRPTLLKDTIKVLLEERNPDTSFGWTKPIITDTIKFIRQ